MSKVIMTVTLPSGLSFDLTQSLPAYGGSFGWSEGPGPNMRGCAQFETIGQALDHALTILT